MSGRVLIVEDEQVVRESLEELCAGAGHVAEGAADLAQARKLLDSFAFDLVLLDLKLPDGSGLDLLQKLGGEDAPPVVVLTAFPEVDTAVRALRLGAYDYINKPFDLDELEHIIAKALETSTLRREVVSLRQGQQQRLGDPLGRMVGDSEAMLRVRHEIATVAATHDTTVLILGESGVGKELVAEAIHHAGARREGPLLKINCASIPANLLEDELFGHEAGAFTDAKATRKGLFELAHTGTLFMDEIGEMEPRLQAKLLRILEERVVTRVGGERVIPVDVRVVTATNQDLPRLIAKKIFRQDLYFRLNVFPITVAPLRERGVDVIKLAEYFLAQFGCRAGGKPCTLSGAARDKLLAYPWPGNVRELRNILERTVLLHRGGVIEASLLPLSSELATVEDEGEERVATLAELEREHILRIYRMTGRNKTKAAELLGVNRLTLRRKISEYGE